MVGGLHCFGALGKKCAEEQTGQLLDAGKQKGRGFQGPTLNDVTSSLRPHAHHLLSSVTGWDEVFEYGLLGRHLRSKP